MQVSQQPLPRKTFRNLLRFILSGNFIEILKVLRRRSLNLFKLIRSGVYRIFGIYYDHPNVVARRQRKYLSRLLERYYSWTNTENATGKNTIKLALIIRDGTTYPKSSAFIRLLSPLTDSSIKNKLSFVIYPQNTTSVGDNIDICIVQRNAFDDPGRAKDLLKNLSAKKIRLVVDTDDAFNVIDPSHPEHHIHTPTLEAFNLLVKSADQVWLSTTKLKSYLPELVGSAVVVSNSLDERIWRTHYSRRKFFKNRPLKMLYAGTASHDADFDMIFPVLDKLAVKYPGTFELTVVGVASLLPDRPWLKRLHQKRNGSIYPLFAKWLLKQGQFDIGLSPLVDNQFNRGKSDIKCLDYLACGVLPVVSDLEPYQSPELDPYIIKVKNTKPCWEIKLTELIQVDGEFDNKYSTKIIEAQKYIWSKRSSSTTAEHIYRLLKSLVART